MTQPDDPAFYPTLPSSQVRANRLSLAEVELQRVVLTRVQGQLCAFNALCPHQLGNLAGGFLNNGEVECPVHQWRFNILNGQSVYPEENSLRLRRYQVKEEAGLVWVKLQAP